MITNKVVRWIVGLAGALWGHGVGVAFGVLLQLRIRTENYDLLGFSIPLTTIVSGCIGCGIVVGVCGMLWLISGLSSRGVMSFRVLFPASILVGIPLAIIGLFSSTFNPYIPPSDSTLLAQFDKHEATYNRLARMARADEEFDFLSPGDKKTYDYLLNDGAIIQLRNSYLKKQGVRLIQWRIPYRAPFLHTDDDEIYTEHLKGFVFLAHPPEKTVDSLDVLTHEARSYDYKISYRPIRGNWYLFYEYNTQP